MQRLRENSISVTDSWLNDAYNFRTRSTGQYIHHFVPNIMADNGDPNIIH
jgi:hypothetical protein